MWLYQIKTHTIEQSKELISKLKGAGYIGFDFDDYNLKKAVVIVLHGNKHFSFNWEFKNKYGKELDYFIPGDLEFINNNILYIKPVLPKLEFKEITDISVGDLFVSGFHQNGTIIIESGYNTGLYSLIGFNSGLNHWSPKPMSKIDMIKYLNENKRIFVTNLNDKIKKTIDMALKMVNN